MKNIFCTFLVCAAVLVTSSSHAGDVTFNYQGRVKVGGTPFTGTGQFKFSILNTPGTAVLWTNDGTLPTPNVAPTAAVSLPVSEGLFSAEIGSADLGMQPINSLIFSSTTPLRLRVWFNSGAGEQQLNPDYKLMDITFNTVQTGTQDGYLYVDAVNGNNNNNGLTTSTAKKTIQAAVDLIPARVIGNMTVKIFPGIYRELVRISGIHASGQTIGTEADGWDGPYVRILGDETWTTASASSPNVRVTGKDNDAITQPVRQMGIAVDGCSGLTIEGINVDHVANSGIRLMNGTYIVRNCKTTNAAGSGMWISTAFATIESCTSSNNTQYGYSMVMGQLWLMDSIAKSNVLAGYHTQGPSWTNIARGVYELSAEGITAYGRADIGVANVVVRNNTLGIAIRYHAGAYGVGSSIYSGNTTNSATGSGGIIYY